MRPFRFQCGACIRHYKNRTAVPHCEACHYTSRRINSLAELVRRQYPQLDGITALDLFVRLYRKHLTDSGAQTHLAELQRWVDNAPPENPQLELEFKNDELLKVF